MTIKELIEKLKEFPEDAEVIKSGAVGWENYEDVIENIIYIDGKVEL